MVPVEFERSMQDEGQTMNDVSKAGVGHAWIRERIARVPRVRLALTPTPLHEAPNLTRALGGPRILIKRDDLTGVAFGGNKLRNLEFRLARTMAEQPDTVIVGLDLQSNSARQTIGACNKLGLKTILVLEGEQPEIVQGNLLVDYLLGAEVVFAPTPRSAASRARRARAPRPRGRWPPAYPQRQSDVRCGLGAGLSGDHARAAGADGSRGRTTDRALHVVQRQGAGRAGAGQAADQRRSCGARHHRDRRIPRPSRTAAIANETLAVLGLDIRVSEDEIQNDLGFVGAGYGIPTEACVEAVKLFARYEGVILDPIYTGKAAAGMISHIREGRYGKDDVLVFVHTGGTPAIFTWNTRFHPA